MSELLDSSPLSAEGDLYRASFKYFKNCFFVPTSSPSSEAPPVTPNLSRKKCQKTKHPASNGTGKGLEYTEYHVNDVVLQQPGKDAAGRNSIETRDVRGKSGDNCMCYALWGLRSPETWSVVELTYPPGLLVIRNPFTAAGQRYWISRTLLDFPHHSQYITNMDNLNRLERKRKGDSVERLQDFKLDTCGRDFYEKLRWVTFGYHHDWDTKAYSEERRSKFPEDLADMTRYISQILDFKDFEAEAAIANYYHMDSTLSGHVDRSEVNQYAPLFSLSFGQSAVFLIGGKTKTERPQPVLLQSGDIAIMSGESRLSYHGVPKIFSAARKSWEADSEGVLPIQNGMKNTSKRPKYDASDSYTIQRPKPNCSHDCVTFNESLKDKDVCGRVNSVEWTDFLNDYISKSRINLNIRQVLFPGQSQLYSTDTESK